MLMRRFFLMFAVILCADGVIVLLTGETIGGETVSNRLSNGFGLIGVGLGAFLMYEAVRRARRHWNRRAETTEDDGGVMIYR